MKKWILSLALFLVLPGHGQTADWVDQGDGTWTLSVTATAATTAEKDMFEQVRKWHNFKYRCGGTGTVCAGDDQLAPDAWVAALLTGFVNTQNGGTKLGISKVCKKLWNRFVDELHEDYPEWLVSPGADKGVNGMNAVIPAPPAP